MLVAVCIPVHSADIETVRVWAAPARTRVVFDLTAPLEYRLFMMKNPDRLVIDFLDTVVPDDLRLPPTAAAPIKGLRYAARGGRNVRVVLDLTKRLSVRDLLLPPRHPYGHRLVLDLVANDATPIAPAPTPKVKVPNGARAIVVAVDAGHGGEDVGAIGPSGAYEKDIVLAIARELVALIDREEGMRGVLVREGDYYIGLRQRMAAAREARADLFVSIHADAFRDRRVRGSSVYVLSQRGASSEAARWLAENENASDLIGGVTLDDKDDVLKSVLLDLSQTASLDASIDAANAVLGALKGVGKVHKRGVQHAGFVVLKSPDIPSLLVETGFISNPAEERRLRSKKFRHQLVAAMFSGIVTYFEENTPPGTWLAERRRHRVVRGDTLSVIAAHYDVTMASIKLANNLSTDGVRLGAVLKIP